MEGIHHSYNKLARVSFCEKSPVFLNIVYDSRQQRLSPARQLTLSLVQRVELEETQRGLGTRATKHSGVHKQQNP